MYFEGQLSACLGFFPSFTVTLAINLLVKCISSMRSDTVGNVTRPHLSGENILIINPLKAVRGKALFVLPGLITFHSQWLCFEEGVQFDSSVPRAFLE